MVDELAGKEEATVDPGKVAYETYRESLAKQQAMTRPYLEWDEMPETHRVAWEAVAKAVGMGENPQAVDELGSEG